MVVVISKIWVLGWKGGSPVMHGVLEVFSDFAALVDFRWVWLLYT